MVGGRVETTGGRDEFTGHLHAQQHFASGFAVVAGGLENVRDGPGDIAVLQEAQDGLPIGRADGTGTQARELVVVALAQPVDGGHAGFRGEKVIRQDAWLRAEGMFGGEQEATAGGLLQGRSGTRRVQGVGRCLAQGAGQQDGTVGLAGEFDEGRQAAGEPRDGAGRINDDQAGIQVTDEGGQVVQVLGESVRARAGEGQRCILDEGTHQHQMGGIAPGGFKARFEDIGGGVVGG